MADGEAFFVGRAFSGEGTGAAAQTAGVWFEPDLAISEWQALASNCPAMKTELALRREVVGQVRTLAVGIEAAGYRRAAALLLEAAQSINAALIADHKPTT